MTVLGALGMACSGGMLGAQQKSGPGCRGANSDRALTPEAPEAPMHHAARLPARHEVGA